MPNIQNEPQYTPSPALVSGVTENFVANVNGIDVYRSLTPGSYVLQFSDGPTDYAVSLDEVALTERYSTVFAGLSEIDEFNEEQRQEIQRTIVQRREEREARRRRQAALRPLPTDLWTTAQREHIANRDDLTANQKSNYRDIWERLIRINPHGENAKRKAAATWLDDHRDAIPAEHADDTEAINDLITEGIGLTCPAAPSSERVIGGILAVANRGDGFSVRLGDDSRIHIRGRSEPVTLTHGDDSQDLGRFEYVIRLTLGNGVAGRCYSYADNNPGVNGHIHPHVQSDQVCLGESGSLLTAHGYAGDFDLCCDIMESLLNTYNPDSPHFRLEDWHGRRHTCNACGERTLEQEARVCQACGQYYCPEHATREVISNQYYCDACATRCNGCDSLIAPGGNRHYRNEEGTEQAGCPHCVGVCCRCRVSVPRSQSVPANANPRDAHQNNVICVTCLTDAINTRPNVAEAMRASLLPEEEPTPA